MSLIKRPDSTVVIPQDPLTIARNGSDIIGDLEIHGMTRAKIFTSKNGAVIMRWSNPETEDVLTLHRGRDTKVYKLVGSERLTAEVMFVDDDQVVETAMSIPELLERLNCVEEGWGELVDDCDDGLKRIDKLEKEQR